MQRTTHCLCEGPVEIIIKDTITWSFSRELYHGVPPAFQRLSSCVVHGKAERTELGAGVPFPVTQVRGAFQQHLLILLNLKYLSVLWAHLLFIPALFGLAVFVQLDGHPMGVAQLILEHQTEDCVWPAPQGKMHTVMLPIKQDLRDTLDFGHLAAASCLFLKGENEFVLKSF